MGGGRKGGKGKKGSESTFLGREKKKRVCLYIQDDLKGEGGEENV